MPRTRFFYRRAASFLIMLPVLLLAQVQRPFTFPHPSQSSPQSQATVPGMPLLPYVGPKGQFVPRSQLERRGVRALDSTASSIFLEAPQYNSGGVDAQSVAVADVNGDGHPDLVVANTCIDSNCVNGSVGVLLGNGNGTFQAPVSYNSGGVNADSIVLADVNGDGKLDVLVANDCVDSNCAGGSVGVLLGNGDGTFQAPVSYNSGGEYAVSVAAADVNGDGKPDLLVVNIFNSAGNRTQGIVGVLMGNGDGTFQAPVSYNSGGVNASSIVVADVNGDGKPDLLVANQCTSGNNCSSIVLGNVGVLLGNGDGTFQAAVSYSSGGEYGASVVAADVNGDGKLDLLVANACVGVSNCANGGVGVLLGNGDGTFQAPVSYNSGGYDASSIRVADVNGDGKPDLLVANNCVDDNCASGSVGVLLGNGDGTFQAPASYTSDGVDTYSIAVGDLNGDGKPDLLVANNCADSNCANGTVGVLLGNGDGTFQSAIHYNPGGDEAQSIAVGDLNGDGKPDLLVANLCGSMSGCANGGVGVLLGNGDGTFQSAVSYSSGGYQAQSIAVGDVNGDGKLDLLVANVCGSLSNCSNGGVVGVLLGNGDGTFQAPVDYNSGGLYAYWIAAADVNGDGKPDLLVANYCVDSNCANGSAVVMLGNGDGTFQAPVSYNSGGYGANSIGVADVNGDGKPDLLVANYCDISTCKVGVVGVLLGNGDGTFQAPAGYNSGGYQAQSIAVGDMNGDGKPDLLVGNACVDLNHCGHRATGPGSVGVLLGNGDGTFQAPVVTDTSGILGPGQIAVADFNGDGKLDAAIGVESVLYLGNGDGTFQNPLDLGAGGAGTAVGDFNGDGRPDLAVGGVTVLINTPTQQPQTIAFATNAPASALYNSQFTVAATATSGLPVAYTSSGACTNSGATYMMTNGTGTCSVIANQAGNSYNAAAPQVTETVNAVPLSQTIAFVTPAPPTSKKNDSFRVSATGGASGNPVTFAVGAASVCSITGSALDSATYKMSSNTGNCYVVANQAGNNNYAAAQVTETVNAVATVVKVAPTVSFTGAPATAAYLSTFTVATTENSGVSPTITSTTSTVCTVSGNVVTMKKGAGTCTVKASWATDTYYLAASLTQSTTATLLGTTTSITNSATLTPTNLKKVTVYFAVSNGQNAVTGNVTVTASTGEHCTGTVTVGKCLLTLAATGPNSVTAVYAGNTNDATSTSAAYPLNLPTTTAVSSSPNPSTFNSSVSVTATVTSSSGTPTGAVSFASGSTNLGTATLVSGSAGVMTSTLPIGSDPITATYNPTGSFAASAASETQIVTDAIMNFSVVNVSQTTATETWTTSMPSTSQVCIALYPPTTYDCTAEDMNLVTSHSVQVTGLASNTVYSVYAVGTEEGQTFTSNVINFRTLR